MRTDRRTGRYEGTNCRFSQFCEHAWILLSPNHQLTTFTLPIEPAVSSLQARSWTLITRSGQEDCLPRKCPHVTYNARAVSCNTGVTPNFCCVHRVRYHRHCLSHVRMKTRSESHFHSEHGGIRFSETSVNIYHTLRPPIPEDKIIHNYCRKKPAYQVWVWDTL